MPFSGIRVVELGTGVAVDFCGKILADFGAEVVKVEPPGGDPGRAMDPLVEIGGGRRESGYFAWLNTNKHSITADPEDPAGADRLGDLLAGADVLLDARPPKIAATSPLQHDALRAANPGLVVTAISWFGEDGPYRDFAATESVCRALAGVIAGVGPVEGPPVLPTEGQSGLAGGFAAFIATAAGLLGRERGARRFSVSIHEALTHISELEVANAMLRGRERPRSGVNRFGKHFPSSIYPTKEGWIGISTITPDQWQGLCEIVGRPDLGLDPRYRRGPDRVAAEAELEPIIAPLLLERTAAEWFDRARKRRLAFAIVPTMAELLGQAVHRERGAFVPVELGEARFEGPILAHRVGPSAPLRGGRAPLAGQHDRDYPRGVWPAAASGVAAPAGAGDLPLAGIRIIDLTMGWAGPMASRHAADLGAEVIKVESTNYPDWWRGADTRAEFYERRAYERDRKFLVMNRNKLGVTLDLKHPDGVALLKRLVASADAVIENYSVDVLPKLGLDDAALRAVNPRLVMVSMPAFGSNNEWSVCRAYGGTLEQASGLPSISGEAEWPPTMATYAHGDPIGGFNGATALMIGLMHQKRTGTGARIDMSQVEGMLALSAPKIIEQSVAGRVGPRLGNRHSRFVPHGCYRCAGPDDWIVIAAADDAQWRALRTVIDMAGVADPAELETAAGRRPFEDAIDRAIAAWTGARTADQAMAALQRAGVPAGVARSTWALLSDPHLIARGFWQHVDRAFVGPHMMGSAAYRLGSEPLPVRRPAPTLGQHTADLLGAVLGLSPAEVADLAARRITGTEMTPRTAPVAKPPVPAVEPAR